MDTNASLPESRRRGPQCLSDLALDGLIAGELSTERMQGGAEHLENCAACTERVAFLRGASEAFLATHNLGQLAAEALEASTRARGPGWWWRARRVLVPATVALAGAAALVLVLRPRPTDDGVTRGFEPVRTRGGGLKLFVLHPARGETAGTPYAGEALAAGDRIRFGVREEQAAYVAVVAVDGRGAAWLYHPASPDATGSRVPAGREVTLDGAVELDASAGLETIVALMCREPIKGAEALAAARAAVASAAAAGRRGELPALGLPCEERRAVVAKASAGTAR